MTKRLKVLAAILSWHVLVTVSVFVVPLSEPTYSQAPEPLPPLPNPATILRNITLGNHPYVIRLAEDAGVKPGMEHAARNRNAVQNAVSAVSLMPHRAGQNVKARLLVPDYDVWMTGAVWADQYDLEIIGTGPNSSLRLALGYEGSVLILGAKRREGGDIDPADFPVNPLAAGKWGLTTGRKHHVGATASPFAFGPEHYTSIQQLSIDVALDTTARAMTSGPVCGAQEGNGPAPLVLMTHSTGKITALWRLRGGGLSGCQWRTPGPWTRGVQRIALTLDLATRTSTGRLDGVVLDKDWEVWRPNGDDGPPASPIPPLGTDHFVAHNYAPFLIGAAGTQALSHGSTPWGADADHELTIIGLQYSKTLRPSGRSDADTYWGNDEHTIAFLPLDQSPAQSAFWRSVHMRSGLGLTPDRSRYYEAHLFHPDHASPWSSVEGYRLDNIKMGPYNGVHGQVVAMAHALNVTIENCRIHSGGAHAIGCLGSAANYTINIRNCSLAATDAALFALYCNWYVSDINVPWHGQVALLRCHQANVGISRVFVGPFGEPDTIISATGGSYITLRDAVIDIESGDYPFLCAFWFEAANTQNVGPGGFDFDNVVQGSVPPWAPIILLTDQAPSDPGIPRGTIRWLTHQSGTRPRVIARDSNRWHVKDDDNLTGFSVISPSGVAPGPPSP